MRFSSHQHSPCEIHLYIREAARNHLKVSKFHTRHKLTSKAGLKEKQWVSVILSLYESLGLEPTPIDVLIHVFRD